MLFSSSCIFPAYVAYRVAKKSKQLPAMLVTAWMHFFLSMWMCVARCCVSAGYIWCRRQPSQQQQLCSLCLINLVQRSSDHIAEHRLQCDSSAASPHFHSQSHSESPSHSHSRSRSQFLSPWITVFLQRCFYSISSLSVYSPSSVLYRLRYLPIPGCSANIGHLLKHLWYTTYGIHIMDLEYIYKYALWQQLGSF